MQYRRTESNFPTFESRLEDFMKFQDHLPHYFSRGVELDPRNNVIGVINHHYEDLGYWEKTWNYGANLVTNDGDIYYALKGCGETPAANENFFQGRCVLNNPGTADTLVKTDVYTQFLTPISASNVTITATYPQTVDPDVDNTGDGTAVVTYKYDWTTGYFNATGIKGGVIVDQATPTTHKLLTHFNFAASFDKTASDTLKVFVNHTMLGA